MRVLEADSARRGRNRRSRRRVAGRRTRRKIDLILRRAHLKLRLRNVDLAAVDELDDELEVVEADVLRHDDRRVFAGVRQQELLEVGAAGRQHHLKQKEQERSKACRQRRRSRLDCGFRLNLDTRTYRGAMQKMRIAIVSILLRENVLKLPSVPPHTGFPRRSRS